MTTTFEEAKRCPKCGNPGKEVREQSAPRGGKTYMILCESELCPWYNTQWLVQVRADGTIPERKAGVKEFQSLDPGAEAFARRQIEELKGL